MEDIAVLGIEVQTKSVTSSANELDRLSASGGRAETAVNSLKTAFAGLAGAMSVAEMSRAVDSWQTLNSQLAIATGSARNGAAAYQDVLRIATATGQSLEGVGAIYQKLAQSASELGMSQERIGETTETVSKAMALSGASAEAAHAAITQFGQALSSGTLRGDELNSVLEQSPRLARALADGLGVSVGQLRALGAEGKITSEALVEALGKSAAKIDKEFAQLPVTMSRAMQNLRTEWVNTMGDFESSSGAFGAMAQGVNSLAKNMDVLVLAGTAVAAVYGGRMLGALASATAAKVADAAATMRQAVAMEAASVASSRYTGLMLSQSAAVAAAASSMTAASTATATAASLARGAMTALGGPIGLITTALTVGATAWAVWGNKAEATAQKTASAVSQELDSVISKIQEMNSKLEQTSRKSFEIVAADAESKLKTATAQINFVQNKLDQMDAAGGRGRFSAEGKALQEQLNALSRQEIELQAQVGEARRRSAEVGTAALQKFVDENAVGAAKVAKEREKIVSEFAAAIAQTGGIYDESNKAHIQAKEALDAKLAELGKKAVDRSAISNAAQAIKAEIAGIVDAAKEGAQAQIAAVKEQHAEGLLSWGEYYDKIAALQEEALRAEVTALGKGLDGAMKRGDKAEIQEYANKIASVGRQIQKTWQDAAYGTARVRADLRAEMLGTLEQETAALEQKAKQMRAEADQYGMTASEIYEAAAARVEERIQMSGYGEDSEEVIDGLKRQKQAYVDMSNAARDIDGKKATEKSTREATEEWNRAAADIEKSITDSLMRGFESGKGFAENLRDTIVNMFKTLVLRPVVQFGVQGALSAVGLGSLSGAANAAQTVGSAGNLLNAGKGVLDLFNGGFSAPGSLYSTFATSGLGASLGLSSYGALSASSIGTGASLGFGGLGASGATAGSGATLTSLGSTIGTVLPWIGAALAVASLFGGKRGGPKFEGSTLYDFSDDAFKLPSTVGGEDRDRDGGRTYAEQLTQATFAGVEATINALGGDASALAARFGFNRDNKGDAPQNIGTTLYKGGSLVYQSYNDYGREDAEFAKGVELELKKLTVAAIGAADDLPPIFGKIVSGIDLVSASSEQLDAVLTQLSDSKTILDYASFDPFEQYNAALKAQESGLTGAWDTQRQAVEKLIQSFDGSASATSALAGGIRSLAEIEAQAVAYINQSIAALRSNTQADAEGMYLGTLDNQAQYNYRIGLSQRLEDQLATAQSPEQIMALYERLRGNYQSAYGLLSDTQQVTEGSKYFGRLNSETGQFDGGYLGDLQAQVEAMLAPFGQTLADAHDLADPESLAAQIAAAFGNIPDSLDVSAGALASAAGSLQSVAGVLAGITGAPAPEETIEAPVLAIAQGMTSGMDAAVTRFLDAAARMDAAAARMEAATATPLQVQSSVTLNAFVSPGVEVNA